MRANRRLLLALLCLIASAQPPCTVSATRLRRDLSFLASDALRGRYTPSPGLQTAAAFIAARFRSAGLTPLGKASYLQKASMIDRTLPKPSSPISVTLHDVTHVIEPKDYTIVNVAAPFNLRAAVSALCLDAPEPSRFAAPDIAGKLVLLRQPSETAVEAAEASRAALVIVITREALWPTMPLLFEAAPRSQRPAPVINVRSDELASELIDHPDASDWHWDVHLPGPRDTPVTLANVAGFLLGSDPSLKDQAVVVSAHYDHIGTARTATPFAAGPPTANDTIYNGANDDASGIVSLIGIAQTLAHEHLKRSLIFLAFFGEERGLIGSQFYVAHPLFPLSSTVADFNLEQLGRVDNLQDGQVIDRPHWLTLTGFDYTNLARLLADAGRPTGVTVDDDAGRSDRYFLESDNASFARAGVPSTTVAAALEYPDYHRVGDEWQKIDFSNMAHVDCTIAQAVFSAANAAQPPHWNESNPSTARYRKRRAAE